MADACNTEQVAIIALCQLLKGEVTEATRAFQLEVFFFRVGNIFLIVQALDLWYEYWGAIFLVSRLPLAELGDAYFDISTECKKR